MRALLLSIVLLASPAVASDRFGADNPWFEQFEATCRTDLTMNEECQASVLSAYAEQAGTDNISCDFALFWQTRDQTFSSRTFAVLPWQNGVEAIVAAPGVCSKR